MSLFSFLPHNRSPKALDVSVHVGQGYRSVHIRGGEPEQVTALMTTVLQLYPDTTVQEVQA